MTAQSQLEAYLGEFRKRLKSLIVARGAAILAAAALVITLLAVYFGIRRAFDPTFVYSARAVLVLALGALAAWLLVLPLLTLRRNRGIPDIERRAPDFNGRLETYDGLTRAEKPTPFLPLLAEDALKYARKIPVMLKVPALQVRAPAVLAVLAAGTLVWFAAFGPANWRYGVRHLWAGWLLSDTLPPQHIAVEPGDGTVRRGGDLHVLASAEGLRAAAHGSVRAVHGGRELGKHADDAPRRRQLRLHVLRAARADALLRAGGGAAKPGIRGRRRRSAADHEPEAHLQLSELDEARADHRGARQRHPRGRGHEGRGRDRDRHADRRSRARRERRARRDDERRQREHRDARGEQGRRVSRVDAVQRRRRESHRRLPDHADPRQQAAS